MTLGGAALFTVDDRPTRPAWTGSPGDVRISVRHAPRTAILSGVSALLAPWNRMRTIRQIVLPEPAFAWWQHGTQTEPADAGRHIPVGRPVTP